MPPSWSARLLSSAGSNHNHNSSSSSNTRTPAQQQHPQDDKPLPRPPPSSARTPPAAASSQFNGFNPPPTLHANGKSPSPRPHLSNGGRQHSHGRSVSQPLPKIFGRKKSARDLAAYHDTDVPLDDSLVPVFDDAAETRAPPPQPAPTRVISGNKGKKSNGGKAGPDDNEDKAQRRCMCCDSRVSVPRELDKFRCLECLTINDLKPLAQQREAILKGKIERDGTAAKPEAGPAASHPGGRAVPITMERTRAIIDRCLAVYLQARIRKLEDELAPSGYPNEPAREHGLDTMDKDWPLSASGMPTKSYEPSSSGKQLSDVMLASSPPDASAFDDGRVQHTATIRDLADIDQFGYMRTETPPVTPPLGANGPSMSPSGFRKPLPPRQPSRKPPPAPLDVTARRPSQRLHPNSGGAPNGQSSPRPQHSPRLNPAEFEQRRRYDRIKTILRPLEDYISAAFSEHQTFNTSFSTTQRPVLQGRTRSESNIPTPPPEPMDDRKPPLSPFDGLSNLDAKTLLLGELGENSSWWTGKLDRLRNDKSLRRKKVGEGSRRAISSKSPNINWTELRQWYELVHSAGHDWRSKILQPPQGDTPLQLAKLSGVADDIDEELEEAREHASRVLLKATETLLKRPGLLMTEAEHVRWLFIILANPELYPSYNRPRRMPSTTLTLRPQRTHSDRNGAFLPPSPKQTSPQKSPARESSQHTGILKRVFGLLANTPENCQRYVISWLSRFDEDRLIRLIDLVSGFVTHRVAYRSRRPRGKSAAADNGLIPDLSGSAANTSAQLHSALGLSGSVKKRGNEPEGETDWANDWQVKAGAKVMSLLFAANNIWQGLRNIDPNSSQRTDSAVMVGSSVSSATPSAKAKRSGQLLHTSAFYNTLIDYHDVIADFKVWESKREKFAFCQYPLFLSMGAKIKILEYDARRQMEIKAREAYFDSVIRQRALDGYFHLRVRRDCMVDDSLRQISEAVGANAEELKKGLRVHFAGEEGVDAGGLRKEWFLMLVREIFDPEHGMFVYDDESRTCYFNPHSFETSDQYYLVGALLGLAIYNSTILDVALPPFAFRKLLASAPAAPGASNISSLTGAKGQMTYTIADLAEFRPSLAAGLQQLLDFDGDVEATYCRDFVAPVERYGVVTNVPLISNGEGTPVTNANRHEFVDAYIRYLIDTSVARQFEPFKRGFFTVCAGNALSLFRAEEIELLVRGSDEILDVSSLKAVAVYENWRTPHPPHTALPRPDETVPVIQWFWECFAQASLERQRKLLIFITGSDRIPAVGSTSLILKIVAGGDGTGNGPPEERTRFPVARTCFNMLVLWRYESRAVLEEKLWRAVEESEGFGLK